MYIICIEKRQGKNSQQRQHQRQRQRPKQYIVNVNKHMQSQQQQQRQRQQCVSHATTVSLSPIFGRNQLFIMYQGSAIASLYVELALSVNNDNDGCDSDDDVSEYVFAMLCVCTATVTHSCYAIPLLVLFDICMSVCRFDGTHTKRMKWYKMRLTADFLLFFCHFSSSSSSFLNIYTYIPPQFSFVHNRTILYVKNTYSYMLTICVRSFKAANISRTHVFVEFYVIHMENKMMR